MTGELSQTVETCLVETAVQYASADANGNPEYAVPNLEVGCFHVNNEAPEAGLEASLQDWLLSVVASDLFAANYE